MSTLKHRASRERVHREAASVVEVSVLPGGHCRLRVRAPRIAADAKPGQFVNVSPLSESVPVTFRNQIILHTSTL